MQRAFSALIDQAQRTDLGCDHDRAFSLLSLSELDAHHDLNVRSVGSIGGVQVGIVGRQTESVGWLSVSLL